MKRMMWLSPLFAIAALTSGCGSDSETTAATASVISLSSALKQTTASVNKVSELMPDTTTYSTLKVKPQGSVSIAAASAFSTTFAGTSAPDKILYNPAKESPTPVNVQSYMEVQMNQNAKRDNGSFINIFGRYKQAMGIPCVCGVVITNGADGYPANGSQTITFASITDAQVADIRTNCGAIADDVVSLRTSGASLPAEISDATDTTYYDKKIVFTLPSVMGSGTQTVYFRTKSNEINVLSAETNSNGTSRAIVRYVPGGILSTEYFNMSGSSSSDAYVELRRLRYDEANDLGAISHWEEGNGTYTRWTLKGKPTSGGTFAFAMDIKGNGSYNGDYDRGACVNVSTGAIATDGSLACTVTGVEADDLATVGSAIYASWANRANIYTAAGPTMTTAFHTTEGDIFTGSPATP